MTDAQNELADLERRRCIAIGSGNMKDLADILADDYLHVYGQGRTSDKAGYLAEVQRAPREPERGELTIRVYGEAAVITGPLLNRIQYPEREGLTVLDTFVTQVARKAAGKWQFVSFQITPKAK